MEGFINIIVLFIVFCAGLLSAIRSLAIIQQKNYKKEKSTPTIKKEKLSIFIEIIIIGMLLTLIALFDIFWATVSTILLAAFYIIDKFIRINEKTKLPLKYTKRIKRLFSVYIFTIAVLLYLISFFGENHLVILISFILLSVNSYLVETLNRLISPLEELNNERYVKNAQEKLQASNLIKIGITGSFGKTSVKNILFELLSKKYKVLKTEQNYNTPLGIALCVNRSNLNDYEIFIAEMGARYIGDIQKLTEIVKPTIAITTGIAEQHLATFKSIDNIISEKSKLSESIPENGFCVFNLDNSYSVDIFNKNKSNKTGISIKDNDAAKIFIKNIKINNKLTNFDIVFNNTNEEIMNCETKLLGEHNVVNIALAVGVARYLGIENQDMISAIRELKPVPHRLEIIENNRDITILDDTYNANIEGVKSAFQVLKQFSGRKVVLTQGIAEGGDKSKEINTEVGKYLSQVADLVMLTGVNAKYIEQGLMDNEYDKSKILIYGSLQEAEKDFIDKIKKGDVFLLQNDLIDIS